MRKLLAVPLMILANICSAAEIPTQDEAALHRARMLIEEGDVASALPIVFKIMREAPDKDRRGEARETLENIGLSRQDILQLEPSTLKPEELQKIATSIGERMAARRRLEMDIDYAKQLMSVAVSLRFSGGEVSSDVQQKELCRSLDILLKSALADNGGEQAREAQKELEQLGIVGARVSAVKQCITTNDILPAEIQKEIVCSVSLRRLERYKEWVDQNEADAESNSRREAGRALGQALYKYLLKTHAQSAQLQQSSELLDFWREASKPEKPLRF